MMAASKPTFQKLPYIQFSISLTDFYRTTLNIASFFTMSSDFSKNFSKMAEEVRLELTHAVKT